MPIRFVLFIILFGACHYYFAGTGKQNATYWHSITQTEQKTDSITQYKIYYVTTNQ